MKSARLDSKWTYRWTQKEKSYTEKYIIIMQVYFERKCWVMDEILKQVESIKEQTEKAIQKLNTELQEKAQALSDMVDVFEDYVTVSDIEGFYLDYKKYMEMIEKQQEIYDEAINNLMGLYGKAYKKGEKDTLGKIKESYTAGYEEATKKAKKTYEKIETECDNCMQKQEKEKRDAYNLGYKKATENEKAKYKKLEIEHKNYIKEQDKKISFAYESGYKRAIENEKEKYKQYEVEYENCIKKQDEEIEVLQHKLKELQLIQRDDRTLPPPSGKALEISGRKVEEIIKLYIREEKPSIRAISKQTGCTRNQITRIVKGQLKHQKSKEKVVHAIKRLLKVNQNPKIIEKLNKLMSLYIVNTAS